MRKKLAFAVLFFTAYFAAIYFTANFIDASKQPRIYAGGLPTPMELQRYK